MVAACVRLQPAERRMMTVSLMLLAVVYGFGMFVAGTLAGQTRMHGRLLEEWLHGFRDGWEAAEQFDNDVRIIWGGNDD
jgi:hypothetical protein